MTISRISQTLGVFAGFAAASAAGGGIATAETETTRPSSFTSAFTVTATPDQIYNADKKNVPGEAGATGVFNFMINSKLDVICYDITLQGVTPPYMSMAKTATHIHAGAAGVQGAPRIAFPNPSGSGSKLTSAGCLKGPFTTGIIKDGKDTGEGFKLADLEANPAGYYADTHTEKYTAGAVRGQLDQKMPVGGVDTGMGGAQEHQATGAVMMAGAGAVGVAGAMSLAGAVALRRASVRRSR